MKPVVLIVVVVVVAGFIIGAGMTGMVNIPGLTPAKKKAVAAAQYGEGSDPKDAQAKTAKDVAKKPEAKRTAKPTAKSLKPIDIPVNREAGYKKIAKLWNEMNIEDLKKLVAKGWSNDELAPIFALMDNAKVAKVLVALPPDRATKITKAIQRLASIAKPK